jgi:hypothetical protein
MTCPPSQVNHKSHFHNEDNEKLLWKLQWFPSPTEEKRIISKKTTSNAQ